MAISNHEGEPPQTLPSGGRWPEPAPWRAERLTTQSLECPTCRSGTGRNLVICIDGTSNQFGEKNTNVVELYSRLVKDNSQLTFYNSGIGTYAKPSWRSWGYRKQVVKNVLDLAFALRFEKIVLSAYAWLVDHYTDNDRIFLFGFSRGAYQVRALSAMIDTVGLLHKGNNDQIPFAYELYAAGASHPGKLTAARRQTMQFEPAHSNTDTLPQRFKETFSRSVKIHFVGAWDTVSSVGFIRDKTLPRTTEGMQHVCFFRHALALHEYRVKFLPEYVNGGDGPLLESISQLDSDPPRGPHTKEVWFSGSHSDIGGGNAANTTLDRFGPALRWMSFEAMLAGLKIKEGPRQWEPLTISRSLSPIWWLIEFLPIKRLTYANKNSTTWMPHRSERRVSRPGQYVHSTAKADCGELGQYLGEEPDAYTTAEALLHSLTASWFDEPSNDNRTITLKLLWSSQPGRQSLLDLRPQLQEAIYQLATLCERHADIERANDIMGQLIQFRDALAYSPLRKTQPLSELLGTTAADKYETFGFLLRGHRHPVVRSVAFLSRRFVVSASWDCDLRIWDIFSGRMVGEPLSHEGMISWVSVAHDGKKMASCADDWTIRIWKLDDEGRLVARGPVLRPDATCWAVAYMPQSDSVVCGSTSGKITIWDADTGEKLGSLPSPHSQPISSLAVSMDGTRIVSASETTLLLWDADSREQIGAPMTGHKAIVTSVAFAPGGDLIASSGADASVRVWTTATQETKFILDGRVGHGDHVYTVAFSPVTRHLASASWDGTVRIWHMETGGLVGTLKGEAAHVWSVAFSPDGTRIVSGGNDSAVCIWDRIDV